MLDPVAGLEGYDPGQAVLPSRPDLDLQDFVVMSDPVRRTEIATHNELAPTSLNALQVEYLLAFLHALPPDAWTRTAHFGDARRDVYGLAHHITQHDVDLLRTIGYRLHEGM